MSITLYSFLLTFLAGFATLIGYFVIYLPSKHKDKIINASLSFAVGVMVSISIFDLIPESFNLLIYNDFYFKIILIMIFVVVGVCFSIIIDRVVPNNIYNIG